MRVLITGIGNVGKSTLRENIGDKFKNDIIQIDMDYYSAEIEELPDKIALIEDVHGLEKDLNLYDRIIYLMPPKNHLMLWLKRAWVWFSTGVVDLSSPKGKNKRYSIFNIPIILGIVIKNLLLKKRWIKNDLKILSQSKAR